MRSVPALLLLISQCAHQIYYRRGRVRKGEADKVTSAHFIVFCVL